MKKILNFENLCPFIEKMNIDEICVKVPKFNILDEVPVKFDQVNFCQSAPQNGTSYLLYDVFLTRALYVCRDEKCVYKVGHFFSEALVEIKFNCEGSYTYEITFHDYNENEGKDEITCTLANFSDIQIKSACPE